MFLYLVVAGFDGFGQVVGQWLGRTPLVPRLSPAKTVEGLVGGVLGALLLAAIGWIFYEIVYALNPLEPRATTSWLIAYAVGITRQHGLHRWLSFDTTTAYWPSLRRAYVMYAGTALTGAVLNALLTGLFGLHHRLAWLLCLLATALISLVFLKSYVFAHEGPPA